MASPLLLIQPAILDDSNSVSKQQAHVSFGGVSGYYTPSQELLQTLSGEALADFEWYYEQYALTDVFSKRRANLVYRKLRKHAALILRDFIHEIWNLVQPKPDTVTVQINNLPNEAAVEGEDTISQCFWEALEDTTLWKETVVPAPHTVHIIRSCQSSCIEANDAPFLLQRTTRRILAVTARLSYDKDIPHRLVTRGIVEAVDLASHSHYGPPTFDIVRPGSFTALSEYLQRAHYDIVHFDMHGAVSDSGTELIFTDVDDNLEVKVQRVQAEALAALLTKHGVKMVFFNACRSAAGTSKSSNIARHLVKAGVSVSIGMRFNLLSSTAESFVTAFYRALLEGSHPINAMSLARGGLRTCCSRDTKYGTQVEMDDTIVPLIYLSEGFADSYRDSALNSPGPQEIEVASIITQMQTSPNSADATPIFGREFELLRIESILAHPSNPVVGLSGQPGIGKTAFLKSACQWWSRTGFVSRVVALNFAEIASHNLTGDDLQHLLRGHYGLNKEDSTANEEGEELSWPLLIFEDLDVLSWTCADRSYSFKRQFRIFLRTHKCYRVIITSRAQMPWIESMVVPLTLFPLDSSSAVQFATSCLKHSEEGMQALKSDEDRLLLDQLVAIVDGNPLAIQIVIEDFVDHVNQQSSASLQSYILEYFNLKPINIDKFLSGTVAHSSRAIKELLDYLAGLTTHLHDQVVFSPTETMKTTNCDTQAGFGSSDQTSLNPAWLTKSFQVHFNHFMEKEFILAVAMMVFRNHIILGVDSFITPFAMHHLAMQSLEPQEFEDVQNMLSRAVIEYAEDPEDTSFLQMLQDELNNADISPKEAETFLSWICSATEAEFAVFNHQPQFFEHGLSRRFGTSSEAWEVDFVDINPVYTLVVQSSAIRRVLPAGFKKSLDFASASHWLCERSKFYREREHVALGTLGRQTLTAYVSWDYHNLLSYLLSIHEFPSWRNKIHWWLHLFLKDASGVESSRTGIIAAVFRSFLDRAFEYVESVRAKVTSLSGTIKDEGHLSKLTGDIKNAVDLESFCVEMIRGLIMCDYSATSAQSNSRRYISILKTSPLYPAYGSRETIEEVEFSMHTLQIGQEFTSEPSHANSAKVIATSMLMRQKMLESAPEAVLPALSEGSSILDHFSAVFETEPGLSFEKELWAISYTDHGKIRKETSQAKIPKLEQLLEKVVRTTNNLIHRMLLHLTLAVCYQSVGDLAIASQHAASCADATISLSPNSQRDVEQMLMKRAELEQSMSKATKPPKPVYDTLLARLKSQKSQLELHRAATPREENLISAWEEAIAFTLYELGYFEKSLALYRTVLQYCENLIGPWDIKRMNTLKHWISCCFFRTERIEEAIFMARGIFKTHQDQFGSDMLGFIYFGSSLGFLLAQNGATSTVLDSCEKTEQLAEGKQLLEQTFEASIATYGPMHTNTLNAMMQKVNVMRMTRDLEESEKIVRHALAIELVARGYYTLARFNMQAILAAVYFDMGRYEDAQFQCQMALEGRIRYAGLQSPLTLRSVSCMALYLNVQGKESEARLLALEHFGTLQQAKYIVEEEGIFVLRAMSVEKLNGMGGVEERIPLGRVSDLAELSKKGVEDATNLDEIEDLIATILISDPQTHG